MAEALVDVYSRRDPETEEPLLGDCTLIVGDGTQKIEFRKGRARVPRDVAESLVAGRGDLSIGGIASGDPLDSLTPEEREAVLAVRRQERATTPQPPAGQQPVPPAPPEGPVSRATDNAEEPITEAPPPAAGAAGSSTPVGDLTPEMQERLDAAREHLRDEDEEVPDPAPVGNSEGLVAKTAEGEARCQAQTTAGKQCSNVAVDGPACRLGAHRGQLGVEEDDPS